MPFHKESLVQEVNIIMVKYIFRLDDICKNMNWNQYNRIKHFFLKNHIKPILGVIPNNKDIELLKYKKCKFDFWNEIKNLKYKHGWSIALHGYMHTFETCDDGILKINKKSEFAGISKKKQNEKIMKGKKILLEKGLEIDAFMAPAHSYDRTTIACLKENSINVITDGYGLYPYYHDDVLFIPQLFSKPRKMPFGVYTWCLHINTMTERELDDLEVFIDKNIKDIISFNDAEKYTKSSIHSKVQNLITQSAIRMIRKLTNRNCRIKDCCDSN